MPLIQLRRPLQGLASSTCRPSISFAQPSSLLERFSRLKLDAGATIDGRRYASVKAQGAYKKKDKKTIPKKLGAKRIGDQYVIPGNIIYKQRGTLWHPGENAYKGRDHTIHAAVTGYVKYYRDPLRHPDRQYIGVVFNKEDSLPYPTDQPRKRRLNMTTIPRRTEEVEQDVMTASGIPRYIVRREAAEGDEVEEATPAPKPPLTPREIMKASRMGELEKAQQIKAYREEIQKTRTLRLMPTGYGYRESNWELGRLLGPVGMVAGTEKTRSRKSLFRSKRGRRVAFFTELKEIGGYANERRAEKAKARMKLQQQRAKERAEIAAQEKEARERLAAEVAEAAARNSRAEKQQADAQIEEALPPKSSVDAPAAKPVVAKEAPKTEAAASKKATPTAKDASPKKQ